MVSFAEVVVPEVGKGSPRLRDDQKGPSFQHPAAVEASPTTIGF